MSVLEKDIENRVVTWAKNHNFIVVKVRFVDVGYPDRLFISPTGHTIFIEFKRPGEVPEPIQEYRIRQLKARNIPAFWSDSYVHAVSILKEALVPEDIPNSRNKTPIESSVSRIVSGSRAGENFNRPSYPENSKEQGSIQEGANRGADSTDVSDVAGGDQ